MPIINQNGKIGYVPHVHERQMELCCFAREILAKSGGNQHIEFSVKPDKLELWQSTGEHPHKRWVFVDATNYCTADEALNALNMKVAEKKH